MALFHLLVGERAPLRALARPRETLLDLVNRLGLPLGQACRGEGVCRSCKLLIVRGHEHLTPLSDLERRDRSLDHQAGWRLACQLGLAANADGPQRDPDDDDDADHADGDHLQDDLQGDLQDDLQDEATIVLWNPAWGHSRG